MDLKRVITTILGLPIVALVFTYANTYIIGAIIAIASIISMYEYFGAIKKVAKPIQIIGYLSNIIIILAAFLETNQIMQIIVLGIPCILLILFLKVIITNMKTTFKDVAYTITGILYIPLFLMFLELIRCMENGKILFAYAFVISWSTDIFAYIIGRNFGKHTFSKISPKKSIEGCIAGIVGAICMSLIYIFISNKFCGTDYLYIVIAIISAVLSIISQIGDFVASTIKRFVDLKDYGNLLPGHGGMLDRIDSLIFIAPFLYIIMQFI